MAVIKTPRKKPSTTVVTEQEPAKKRRTALPKKPAIELTEAPVLPAPPAKGPAKVKAAPKAKKNAKAEPEAPVPPPAPAEAPARPVLTLDLPPLVRILYQAIQESRPMEFVFVDAEANAPRTFEPRSLAFDALSQAWFVWGWDRRYNAERHHRVDLLAEINPVEGVGRSAQGPYAEGTPANFIGGWLGGEAIAVKVTLQKQWVFAVKQAPPAFPHFKIEDQGDGQALVSFTATDLRAIARWVMQFGDGAQVLEPARLVDRVKQVGSTWAGRERTAPPASTPRPAAPAEPAPEHRRSEARSHAEPRPHAESRPHREPRHEREETAQPKGGKVEVIKFDRL